MKKLLALLVLPLALLLTASAAPVSPDRARAIALASMRSAAARSASGTAAQQTELTLVKTATPRAKYIAGLALYERANAMVAQAKYVAMLADEKKYLETYSMPWLDNANLETAKALLTAADKMLNDYLAADATFAKKATATLQAAQTALADMDALTAQQEKVEKDRKAWEKEYSKRAITGSSTNTFGSTTFITRQESLISATKRAALSNFKEKYEEKEKLWKKEDKRLVAAAGKLAGVK